MIQIDGVVYNYKPNVGVNYLNLNLEDTTKITGIVGPNGSGKTTLFNLIFGLLKPQFGSIKIDVPLNQLSYLPAANFLIPYLTVRENWQLFSTNKAGNKHYWQQSLALINQYCGDDVLEKLALKPLLDKLIGSLSTGEQKKANLITAFIGSPPALLPRWIILDEPNNGVDVLSNLILEKILHAITANGSNIVLSSHMIDNVEAVVDRAIFLNNGRLLSDYSQPFQTSLRAAFLRDYTELI